MLAGALVVALPAASEVLPMIVDQAGGCWWESEASDPAGALDEALFERARRPGSSLISPRAVGPDGTVSRVFRRPDITENNARSFAGLYGARTVVVGRVERAGPFENAWLGRRRVALVLTAVALDVGSGAVVRELQLSSVAFADEDAAAVAEAALLLARYLDEAMQGAAPAGFAGVPDGERLVIVYSSGTALPFVALRGALRDVHPGVVDVAERWATEGAVALELALDETVSFEEVAAAVVSLAGTTVGDALVADVTADGGWVHVTVVDAPAPDAIEVP